MNKIIFGLLLGLSFLQLTAQSELQILRYPSLSSDGSQVCFSYQGDIWVVSATGGMATRLTIHEAYEHSPQWSPDDSKIVFSSNRYGNDDLFTISSAGRDLNRLTYHSASDYSASWKNNQEILFSTRRDFAQIERESEYYMIGAQGGTPYRHLDVLGLDAAYSSDGQLMAFVRGACRMEREAYVGPANRNIWIYNPATGIYQRLTAFEGQDTAPDWGADGVLYYLSALTGKYNVYGQKIDAAGKAVGEAAMITNHLDEGVDYFDVSRDGSTIVYSQGSNIHIKKVGEVAAQKMNIQVTDDYRFDPEEYVTNSNRAEDLDLSPSEKYLAFAVRGEVFIKENDEDKKLSVAPAPHPSRERDVQWLNDSTVLFLSDRDGDFDLYKVNPKEGNNLFESFEWKVTQVLNTPAEEDYYKVSPDGSQIAVVTIDGHLSIIDVDSTGTMSMPRTMMKGWSLPEDISWSPDSKWIAYAQEDLDYNSEIFILKSDGSTQPVNVSMHPRGDTDPIWSPDGSKLGFLSIRNNGDIDVWFAWLRKDDWERTKSDWEDMDDDKGDKNENKLVQIDMDGIHERLTQVTQMPGNERNLLISKDGETFYFTTNGGGREGLTGDPEFKKVNWDGKDMETVLPDGNISQLQWDSKGKNIYYIKRGGMISKVPEDGKKATALPFSAKMKVDLQAERKQIFDEAWRTLRDRFYDPQFHGRDWNALRGQFESRAVAASTKQDFIYLFNQMLGQLNASHMGLRGQGDEDTQEIRTGRLGIEVKPHQQGLTVTRVVPGSPADKKQSQLQVGDIITAVNGSSVVNQNFYGLINQTVDERIQLSVNGSDGQRQVVIRPTNSMSTLLYDEWVNDRKKLINQYSNGRLGYIHIRGMNWPSFESFERELMASGYGKEGVVIDVRYNGGGWTTDMIMAVLNVRQHSYTVPRGASDDLKRDHLDYKEHYPYGERLPLSAWTKPSIALCNENSYSNAEIFSHAYKHLGHGSLVGMPTFGAVISTGGRSLQDGFFVRVPFRAWYVKATEQNMEHGPAVPDYVIDNLPDSRANNEDLQLQKSVEVLLSQIDGR